MKIVFWGTYDTGKPRTRILIRGLRANGADLTECHTHVWRGVEDKSQVTGAAAKIVFVLRWLFAYPALVWRYLKLPKHDVVLIGYLGQLDVLVLWPFAKLRRARIVWDAFLSLYDTIVDDRRIVTKKNPVAKLIYFWEWLACRAADKVILDTDAHRQLFVQKFRLDEQDTGAVFVGVEPEKFRTGNSEGSEGEDKKQLNILFYGQFIPLHGIEHIIGAARLVKEEPVKFTIVGKGQESEKISAMMAEQPLENVSFISWVEYEGLKELIAAADICLGIFGDSGKAARVIPNKVFQILQAGKPLITMDSPAIRELLSPDMDGVYLIKPASAEELAEILRSLLTARESLRGRDFHSDVIRYIQPEAIGQSLIKEMM